MQTSEFPFWNHSADDKIERTAKVVEGKPVFKDFLNREFIVCRVSNRPMCAFLEKQANARHEVTINGNSYSSDVTSRWHQYHSGPDFGLQYDLTDSDKR